MGVNLERSIETVGFTELFAARLQSMINPCTRTQENISLKIERLCELGVTLKPLLHQVAVQAVFVGGGLREGFRIMATERDKLRDDVKFRILRLLQQNPEMSQRDLAKAVGISTGGIHYVLTALVDKGLLKFGNFTAAVDKRRYAYVLTPKGIAARTELTRKFLIRKMAEYEALRAEIENVRGDLSEPELAAIQASLKLQS